MRTRPDFRPFGKPSNSEVLVLWAPAALGVAVALTLFAAVTLTPGEAREDDEVRPRASINYAWTPPAYEPPPVPADIPGTTTPSPSPSASPKPSPSRSPVARRTTAKPPTTQAPPAPPAVTGDYRVLNSYGDSFIAEVLVTNSSGSGRDWTVRLQFPTNVGRLHTFWVEGAPQATLQRLGPAYVFTSGVEVPARSSVPLRFQFERWGQDNDPSACAVNGTPCD
ncbi:cellulose binding domain-containing protein [Phytohabitans rumicis]|uniref:CBM2 domain-containing protein n=1 Tax=Phytohabitans rumicis TaxID=1076125 RepID=A0A6V8LK09_9ACTN|nr:cellulose binding domain-containing protein [Phytohabitans rumicis]GFJ94959.1 hypothetical protein Prum_086010 [Phytohabitans rumicis]